MATAGSTSHSVNAIGHFDVAGPELPPLARFYATLFGWKVTPAGPGHAMLATPEGPNGALVEATDASLTLGVVVADLDDALKVAANEGGMVVMPAVDNGWVRKAQVADPAGNRITLIQG